MQLAVGCGAQSVRMALSLEGGMLQPEQAEPRMAILVRGLVHALVACSDVFVGLCS